jgi:YD repeat-containing protein
MNKLEKLYLIQLYNHEYEETPNSALYKFNYDEASKKSAEITTDISVKFAD